MAIAGPRRVLRGEEDWERKVGGWRGILIEKAGSLGLVKLRQLRSSGFHWHVITSNNCM